MTQPKVFIIILNWNGKKDTLECLTSLKKVEYTNYEIMVVDNGSSDDSVLEIQKQFPHIRLIETKENLGFAEGNNVGIREALSLGAEYFFLLNNDTVVDPQILTAFVLKMEKNPAVGILGAKAYLYDEPNKLDHFGGMWNPKKGIFDLVALRQIDELDKWETPLEIDYACGCALFIRKEVFKTIGLLEPLFFLIWEEADFCFRARKRGFLVKTCPSAKLWHKVSASFVGGKPHSTYFWWRNRLLWIERNCSFKSTLSLYLRVLLPDILNLYKLKCIKTFQLFILRIIKPKEDLKKRKERVLRYKAALHGVKDYAFRKFGNGPSWIYKK